MNSNSNNGNHNHIHKKPPKELLHRQGMTRATQAGAGTPSSHSKNSATKICSKGWVAQKYFC